MSFWIIGSLIVGTGVITADAQIKGGKQTQYNLEAQADQEKLSAKGEEVNTLQAG